MKGDEFIASPLAVCHSITEANREKAIKQITRCQRCGEEQNTRPDVLLKFGRCYQIIFECLTCSLRLDIFDSDYYKLEDYKPTTSVVSTNGVTSQDIDMRMGQNGSSPPTAPNLKPKIQILLNKNNNAHVQALNGSSNSPNEDRNVKIKINIGAKRSLGTVLNEDYEAGAFKKADDQYVMKKELDAQKAFIEETVRQSIEAERLKRLKREGELMLYRIKHKEDRERRAFAEQELLPRVNELTKWLEKNNHLHDWAKILPECKDPESPFGYSIKKIKEHQKVFLKCLYLNNPVPVKSGAELYLEHARDWQYKEKEKMLIELETHLREAFNEDLRDRKR